MRGPEGPRLPPFFDIEALLLDAGNTIVLLDMEAVSEVATRHGHRVDPARLAAVEGVAKRRYEEQLASGTTHEDAWGLYLATLLEHAGLEADAARSLIAPLRREHDEHNLWRRTDPHLHHTLSHALKLGLVLGVVSNSEGKLQQLFDRLGLSRKFAVVVDSGIEGIAKPDPRIFLRAVERLKVAPARALYLGDIPRVDVDGARAAGLHAALIDPLGFYEGYADAPRFASVAEALNELVSG
ncbi:MAG: HAD family hydrolase [Sandaracinaceae bacterium]